MLQVEPAILAQYVAEGSVSLSFGHILDHGNPSLLSHTAAECAGSQDALAFWKMHDLLYERQSQVWSADAELMVSWAAELGLDGDQMRACLADGTVAAKVQELDQQRRAAGIRLRPTLDLNGEIIQGSIPLPALIEKIDSALQ